MSDFSFKETEKIGLRKMSIFYFDNPIDDCIVLAAETIIEQFLFLSHTEFTKKRGGSDYANIRNIRGGWRKVFHREFDNRDCDSMILTLENSEPSHLQNSRTFIKLHNESSNVYHEIYFQWPVETDWTVICGFIEWVCSLLDVKYASAGYDMAYNVHHYPGSAGQSVRALRDLKYVNSQFTEWGISYCLKAKSEQGIPCPNFIQAFSNTFYSRIEAEHTENMGIHRRFLHNMLFLDILDWAGEQAMEPPFEVIEARYATLYKVLKPLIISYDRPVYLKPDEWVKRQERFQL